MWTRSPSPTCSWRSTPPPSWPDSRHRRTVWVRRTLRRVVGVEPRLIAWAEGVLGAGIGSVRGLRAGGSPWVLETAAGSAVMRVGTADDIDLLRVEQAGLDVAATSGVPVPRVLATELSGDPVALLMELMPGSSRIPADRPPQRLRALGAAAAALHAVAVPAASRLPQRDRPIGPVDFDRLRAEAPAQDLLQRAEEARDSYRPRRDEVFVHDDLWQGNALWEGDRLTAVIDWECAGVGPAGVDVGALRLDAAMCFDVDAADDVLAGWEAEAARCADDVAYWDVVAALSTPPDVGWFAGTISAQGRPDLTRELLEDRRNRFLSNALDELALT
ncbi:MAG: aminoglycoside phosphotransferase family protein [Ilumatobacteraceae bacterium]